MLPSTVKAEGETELLVLEKNAIKQVSNRLLYFIPSSTLTLMDICAIKQPFKPVISYRSHQLNMQLKLSFLQERLDWNRLDRDSRVRVFIQESELKGIMFLNVQL